ALPVELLREFAGIDADVAEVDAEPLLVLGADRMVERPAFAGGLRDQAQQPLGVVLASQLVGELVGTGLGLFVLIAHASLSTSFRVLAFPRPRRNVTLGSLIVFAGFLLVDHRPAERGLEELGL